MCLPRTAVCSSGTRCTGNSTSPAIHLRTINTSVARNREALVLACRRPKSCVLYISTIRWKHIRTRYLCYRRRKYWLLSDTAVQLSLSSVVMRKCGRSGALDALSFHVDVSTLPIQVDRVINVDQDGNLSAEPRLSPYESPDIPEPFLVVRT